MKANLEQKNIQINQQEEIIMLYGELEVKKNELTAEHESKEELQNKIERLHADLELKEIQIKTLIEKLNQQEEHKALNKENEPTSKCKSKEKQRLAADLKQKEAQFESELLELKNDYMKGKNSEIEENLNIFLNRNSSIEKKNNAFSFLLRNPGFNKLSDLEEKQKRLDNLKRKV